MTQQHPDLAAEQQFIDHAYDCLERSKTDAWKLRDMTQPGLGGTFQARYERDVFDEALINRLVQLDLRDAALVFGRIDRMAESPDAIESFHIGRLAVSDENREPVVVDWRAPVAEPFYRATGRETMGLARRRHFAVQGRELLGIEDELFGDLHLGVGHDEGLGGEQSLGAGLSGYSTLLSVLQRGRTGQLGDIVATIQSEQDEIIRSSSSGVLIVQGGPGTGKTVVALHRAAYLLYTFRFPLEDQGVLVIGPNRVFLRYIERVLPSLGEAGVEQVVLADLVRGVDWGGTDTVATARVKGSVTMAKVISKAVADRERPLREDVVFSFRTGYVRLRASESERIVKNAKRRFGHHNAARRWVETEVWNAIISTWRTEIEIDEIKDALRQTPEYRQAIESMWPILTPAELLHDLFGSKALLKLAAAKFLSEQEYLSLYRPRTDDVSAVKWSSADVALLDEARARLGVRGGKAGKVDETDDIRMYGHIVVDEVQDLTPMQLSMVARRSLNGAMTVVGDIAQATGPFAPSHWDDITKYLPNVKGSRIVGLSVGYRIPSQIMELADKVMQAATPGLRSPRSVRDGDEVPIFVRAETRQDVVRLAVEQTKILAERLGDASTGVVCPDSMVDEISAALQLLGVDHGRANTAALDNAITVVPVSLVKGLELDGVVVVEPAAIVSDELHGLRALYVALTRSTRSLVIVHNQELPEAMR